MYVCMYIYIYMYIFVNIYMYIIYMFIYIYTVNNNYIYETKINIKYRYESCTGSLHYGYVLELDMSFRMGPIPGLLHTSGSKKSQSPPGCYIFASLNTPHRL